MRERLSRLRRLRAPWMQAEVEATEAVIHLPLEFLTSAKERWFSRA